MRKLLIAAAIAAALTGAAHADTKEDGQVLGTSIIMLLSESVCETPLTPLIKKLQLGLLKDVSQRELRSEAPWSSILGMAEKLK